MLSWLSASTNSCFAEKSCDVLPKKKGTTNLIIINGFSRDMPNCECQLAGGDAGCGVKCQVSCAVCSLPLGETSIMRGPRKFMVKVPELLNKMETLFQTFSITAIDDFKTKKTQLHQEISVLYNESFSEIDTVIKEHEKIHEKAQHRKAVFDELLATEVSYLTDLRLIDEVIHPEVAKSAILSPQEIEQMFAGIKQLIILATGVTQELYMQKEMSQDEQRVSKVFRDKLPFFKLYIEFCVNQISSRVILADAKKTSKYQELTDKLSANPVLRRLDLSGFMIKPTQRLTKYPLLLKDLLGSTPPTHPDYTALESLLKDLTKIVQEVNRKTAERETILVLSQLQPTLTWRQQRYDLVASNIRLIHYNKMDLFVVFKDSETTEGSSVQGNWIYLFDSIVLAVCKKGNNNQEICHFSTKGMSFQETDNGNIRISSTQCKEEITITPRDAQDRRLWLTNFQDAQIASESAVPPKPVEIPERREEEKEKEPDKERDRSKDRELLTGSASGSGGSGGGGGSISGSSESDLSTVSSASSSTLSSSSPMVRKGTLQRMFGTLKHSRKLSESSNPLHRSATAPQLGPPSIPPPIIPFSVTPPLPQPPTTSPPPIIAQPPSTQPPPLILEPPSTPPPSDPSPGTPLPPQHSPLIQVQTDIPPPQEPLPLDISPPPILPPPPSTPTTTKPVEPVTQQQQIEPPPLSDNIQAPITPPPQETITTTPTEALADSDSTIPPTIPLPLDSKGKKRPQLVHTNAKRKISE
ncbi:rho guanine nucleotide exchange factor 3 [Pelomyxa schiedti]|nr:rho guanine nucleotide exchange factor 3 [Pelomyxa schiedti]